MKALLFDLDDTLVASHHLEQQRRTRDHEGLRAALPELRAPAGLPELLARLAAQYRLGIVTTSPAWYAQTVLRHLYPAVPWGAVVTYADVQNRKPHPEGLLLALEQLGIRSAADAAYLGDQDQDLEAARRAGMHPVRITWCGGLTRPQDETVLHCPEDLAAFTETVPPGTVSSAATLRLLTYSVLKSVGRKTLLDILPDVAADRSPVNRRLSSALAVADVEEQARQKSEEIVAACRGHDVRIISPLDAEYPATFRQMGAERPALVYVRGRLPTTPALAVIGTREPTRHGLEITRRICTHFATRGYSVISGLALGVDTAAHQATLDAQGHTVAILAHGLHTAFPRQNRDLARRIVEQGGALLSEYPPGTEPRPAYFVERDRLQAGLSHATVLVQSDLQGGSWHACRATLRYGRTLAYPAPTPRDLAAEEPKIAGLRLLEDGSKAERAAHLACASELLPNILKLKTRDDYPLLEQCLQRPLEKTDEAGPSRSVPLLGT
ncbi:HAD-IA family hydrolase [Deinococcus aquaticus]|uniref:HAD-IA family hydrolase n=1 Tax=Deinococcus aquaticus TaxID=328692 RepID=UPI003F45D72D